jgi:F-type H+-transporting ATPase subunit b
MLVANSNFLVPNATFVVELLIFLGVLGILAKWVLPVINREMEKRQEAIERSIREAEEANAQARELEEQHRKLVEQGREQARALRDEAAKVGEQLRQELQKKGEEEYQRLVARGADDIAAAARRASEELRSQVAGLVITVVERVLGEGIAVADQQRLIDNAIAEVEAASAEVGSTGPDAEPSVGTRAGQ